MPSRSRRAVLLASISSCLLLLLHTLDRRAGGQGMERTGAQEDRAGDQEDRKGGKGLEKRTETLGVRIISRPEDFPSIRPDRCIRYSYIAV